MIKLCHRIIMLNKQSQEQFSALFTKSVHYDCPRYSFSEGQRGSLSYLLHILIQMSPSSKNILTTCFENCGAAAQHPISFLNPTSLRNTSTHAILVILSLFLSLLHASSSKNVRSTRTERSQEHLEQKPAHTRHSINDIMIKHI